MYYALQRRPGLEGTADSIVSAGASTAGAASGAIASSIGAWTGVAVSVPVVGLAIAGVAIAIEAFLHRRGPAQKVATTHIVNEVEPFLIQNLNAYLSGPRTVVNQQAAEANFMTLWNRVVAECSDPQLGNPGKACIADRQDGTTHVNDQGQSFDWWKLYYWPIANDTSVVTSAPTTGSLFASADPAGSGGTGSISPAALFIGAGLLLAAAMFD